ncbi:Histone deacetylase 8 [Borealophlyctis nickersoniae]|nr:Histone deacetylase 8 [Borealophlyctis nickersoniae]
MCGGVWVATVRTRFVPYHLVLRRINFLSIVTVQSLTACQITYAGVQAVRLLRQKQFCRTSAMWLYLGTAEDTTRKGKIDSCGSVFGLREFMSDEASGFCYVNDIVLGILKLQKRFSRILYIDIDIHHGDGSKSDKGRGKGLHHALNIPLASGLSDETFISSFTTIITAAFESYNPAVIVMQCGADGCAGDPIGREWNLSIRSHGAAVKHVLDLNVPTILLGGGGYSNTLAARCWAYVTGIACGVNISEDIPEHSLWADYAPDFRIWNDVQGTKDENVGVLEDVVRNVLRSLEHVARGHRRGCTIPQESVEPRGMGDASGESKSDSDVKFEDEEGDEDGEGGARSADTDNDSRFD